MAGFDMKDYVPVNERVEQFYNRFPDGSIQSEIVELTASRVTVKAYAYRTPDDGRPGIGHSSLDIPGSTPYTKGSEIENCETSAWGRAIAALGFEVKRGIASAEEVRNKPQPRPVTARARLASVASSHGISAADLERYAEQVGASKPATDEQIEQIIALIEQPEVGLPTPPATPQESTPSGDQGSGQSTPPAATSVQPAGDTPPVSEPAAPSDAELLAAAGPGAELVPPRPGTDEYKALPDGNARSQAKAYWDRKEPPAPKGARETKEAEPISAALA